MDSRSRECKKLKILTQVDFKGVMKKMEGISKRDQILKVIYQNLKKYVRMIQDTDIGKERVAHCTGTYVVYQA